MIVPRLELFDRQDLLRRYPLRYFGPMRITAGKVAGNWPAP